MQNAKFTVHMEKCIGCGFCLKVRPGNMVGFGFPRYEYARGISKQSEIPQKTEGK